MEDIFHMARHTFGTLTLNAGIPIESIAKMMGYFHIKHADLRTGDGQENFRGYGQAHCQTIGNKERNYGERGK